MRFTMGGLPFIYLLKEKIPIYAHNYKSTPFVATLEVSGITLFWRQILMGKTIFNVVNTQVNKLKSFMKMEIFLSITCSRMSYTDFKLVLTKKSSTFTT